VLHEGPAGLSSPALPSVVGSTGLRVAVVAETFLPAVNGVVTSVLRLVDHLAVRGHDPVVVAPSGSSYESRCGARVEVVTVPSMRLPRYRQLTLARPAGDLTGLLRGLAPDVVHLASPAVLGLAAARAARTLGVPSVAVFQTDLAAFAQRYRLPGGPAAAWRYLRTVHGTADLTLAPSSAAAALLARQGIGPVALWARGVDLEQFSPGHRDEALHAELAPDGELLWAWWPGWRWRSGWSCWPRSASCPGCGWSWWATGRSAGR
jgi:phosphatidylinositol alpha 1,6-mannosyltransferase